MAGNTGTILRRNRLFVALSGLLLAGLLISMALPKPEERKYPERTPVKFWHMWTAEWKEVVDEIVERFNRSQDRYEVIPLSIPPSGGADAKFVLSVTGGDPPDVMSQWNPVIPSWAEAGLLQPLEELMTPEEWEKLQQELYPIARKIGIYEGRLYGMTIGLNVFACYYRPDHFREAGLDPDEFPDTLEELFEVARKLERFDGRILSRMGFLPQRFYFNTTLFGEGFYDWNTGEVVIDTPANLRALEAFTAQRDRLGYDNVVRFQAGIDEGSFAGGWPFISGHYSITVDGQWRVEHIARYTPELEYRTAPVPPPEGGRENAGLSNGNFMIIPKGAENPEGAWEFIKFWSGLEKPGRAAELFVMGGWLPPFPSIVEAPAYQEYLRKHPQFRTFVDILPSENLQAAAPVPYTTYLNDRIIRAGDLALRGLITPREALRELAREIRREQERRKALGYGE